jgi:hypothetical protein
MSIFVFYIFQVLYLEGVVMGGELKHFTTQKIFRNRISIILGPGTSVFSDVICYNPIT